MKTCGGVRRWLAGAVLAGLLVPVVCGAEEAPGVKVLYDFEPDEMKRDWGWPGLMATGKAEPGKATRGQQALHVVTKDPGHGYWKWMERYVEKGPVAKKKEEPTLMAVPPNNDYHDTLQWFFERYTAILDDAYTRAHFPPLDYSPYAVLRMDVLAQDAPVTLALHFRDATGPKFHASWTGLRSGTAEYEVPAGKWVTLEFDVKKWGETGELDLARIHGFYLYFYGHQGRTDLWLDNVRLATADAEKPALDRVLPRNVPVPRLHTVVRTPPLPRDAEKLKRDLAPVEALGPVPARKHGRGGCFGGLGVTYYQTTRRGVAAYDNNRVAFIGYGGDPKGRKINPDSTTGESLSASATFDGGKTWGGLVPGEALPTTLNTWYGRAGFSSDYETGALYGVGTENCQSYHGGYDTFFRSLGFTGGKWEPERVSMIDGNMLKCPFWCHVLRLKSGRLWAVWCDGRSTEHYPSTGFPYKHSDDGGLTWVPCKNGDVEKTPRPLYEPDLKDLPVAHEKAPGKVILLPARLTTGPMMAPIRETFIAISPPATHYAIWGDPTWEKWAKIPAFGTAKSYSECTVVSVADRDVFVSKGGNYVFNDFAKILRRGGSMDKIEQTAQTDLAVARFDGANWSHEVLEPAGVWDSILTASGEAVFCFYVKVAAKDNARSWEVRYRRWKDGKWEPSELVHADPTRVNRLAAPARCPPNQAVILWDHLLTSEEPEDNARALFCRIPNR